MTKKGRPEGPQLKRTIPEFRDSLVAAAVAWRLERGKSEGPRDIKVPRRYYNYIMNARLNGTWGFKRKRGLHGAFGRDHYLKLKWAGGTMTLWPVDPKPKKELTRV